MLADELELDQPPLDPTSYSPNSEYTLAEISHLKCVVLAAERLVNSQIVGSWSKIALAGSWPPRANRFSELPGFG